MVDLSIAMLVYQRVYTVTYLSIKKKKQTHGKSIGLKSSDWRLWNRHLENPFENPWLNQWNHMKSYTLWLFNILNIAHINRWFTELKNGWIFHGYVSLPEGKSTGFTGPPGLPRGVDEGQLRGRRRQRGADQVTRASPAWWHREPWWAPGAVT